MREYSRPSATGLRSLGAERPMCFARRRPVGQSASRKKISRQGPGWPLKSDPGYGAHSLTSATYGDIFAQMFLDVEGELDERLRVWRKIIDDERPDLIIADYAPGLGLAAFGTVPLIAIGNGYTLPPVELTPFQSSAAASSR